MSKTVEIESAEHFNQILQSSRIVIADFYATWCAPCKQIAPVFEQLSRSLSKPNVATFVKINTEGPKSRDVATAYAVSSVPTFIIYKDSNIVERLKGADPQKLQIILDKLKSEIDNAGEGSSSAGGAATGGSGGGGMTWRGADLPRGYTDITDSLDVKGLELLNADADFSVRTLFNKTKPSALGNPKSTEKDWVESDTDEQLLLYMPFNSALKLHTLQITSLAPQDDEDDEAPSRPTTVKLFINRPHNLGFDEAEDSPSTQTLEIGEDDWNANGTANLSLRFVRFQNVTSLVLFVEEADGDSEKVRLDRIRLIGESGEKREMGKLEKIGDEPGE